MTFAPTSYWNRFLNWLGKSQLWWPIEWALSWVVVTLFCLKYLWDDYRFQVRMDALRVKHKDQWAYTVPLASVPQTRETLGHTEALHKLVELLSKEKDDSKDSTANDETDKNDNDKKDTAKDEYVSFADAHIVTTLNNSLEARLLASQAMVGRPQNAQEKNHHMALIQQLERLWPQLLELPRSDDDKDDKCDFEIALIVPAFRESSITLLINLTTAWKYCADPQKVHVLVVDAGGCGDLHDTFEDGVNTKKWGRFEILDYRGGGGRGGCMNYGASKADSSRVLTFLHSDTLLPDQWDACVRGAIRKDNQVNLAAFGLGIDTTKRGLKGERYPPGLGAAAWQGRIRSNVCQLPYGDSALSVRASTFRFLGGYPHHQPLMEDYALVKLLKQRAALFLEQEPIAILPLDIACSPRRWQALGVPYVALANWTFVSHYQKGMFAEDLYEMYYGQKHETAIVLLQNDEAAVPQATESSDTVDSGPAAVDVGPAVRTTEEVKDSSRLYRATAADIMEAYRASKSQSTTSSAAEEKKKDA